MKAGTAQRVALNLLSTLVMIRLGRVHEGLMVDVQAINAKLVGRSENILRRLSGRSEEELRDALQRAGGNLKKAMLQMKLLLFWNRPAGVCEPRCGLQEAPLKDG
jgi:N-acetylmuramic acid 6-phosphate etherase